MSSTELAPRVYDQRITKADAERRFKKDLKEGGTLSAIIVRQQTTRSICVPKDQLTDKDFYRVVETGLIRDGKVMAHAHYRRDGRVQVMPMWQGNSSWQATSEWPAFCDDAAKPPTRSAL